MVAKILLVQTAKTDNYINAVKKCGAKAVQLPYPNYDQSFDGLILCGGGDVDPKYYGQQNYASKDIDERRDECEFNLLYKFISDGKPVLGICRGLQVINVYFGGTLFQEVQTFKNHYGKYDLLHAVECDKSSFLGEIYGQKFVANSMHRQAIDKLGKDLKISCKCAFDGVIEGVEHCSAPVFGVQFHPERLCLQYKHDCAIDGLKVIDWFIKLCKKQKAR